MAPKNLFSNALMNPKLRVSSDSAKFSGTVEDIVAELRPAIPLYVIRPEKLVSAALTFRSGFRGEIMYAVKCNPDPNVIRTLYKAGIKAFDVASIEEVRLVRKLYPRAKLYFMHPVKAREAIREAYFAHGVRAFSLDSLDELHKILNETDLAGDLELFIRLALRKNKQASIDFSGKFGILPQDAVDLLRQCRQVSQRLGLAFHVGTQSAEPEVYARAVRTAAEVIKKSGVVVDALDVGGGYPVDYAGQGVPDVSVFLDTIRQAVSACGLGNIALLCEPGRALVAHAGSLVVRVEHRRGNTLYINDGTYGGLFDAAAWLKTRYPVRGIRVDSPMSAERQNFRLAGPTCDSLDMMEGPFELPADIEEGDWIEIARTGAYSSGLRSNFNGFGKSGTVLLFESAESLTSHTNGKASRA